MSNLNDHQKLWISSFKTSKALMHACNALLKAEKITPYDLKAIFSWWSQQPKDKLL